MKFKITLTHLLVILVIVVVAAFLIKYLKKEERTIYTQASGQAKSNNFYAAELFFKSYGIETNSVKYATAGFNFDDIENQTIFLSDYNSFKNKLFIQNLNNWVKRGGKVIMPLALNLQSTQNNIVFKELEISVKSSPSTTNEDTKYNLFNSSYELDLYHFSIIESPTDPLWTISDEHGIHIAAFEYGHGELVLFTDVSVFNNINIGKKDHARLLLTILTHLNTKHVTHIQKAFDANIFGVLNDYKSAVIIFILLILCIIWYFWGYFGPVRAYIAEDNRVFTEHLEFSGQYLWKNKQYPTLYDEIARLTINIIQTRIPQWLSMSNDKQLDSLALVTGLEHEILHSIINTTKTNTKHEFFIFCKNTAIIRSRLR